MTLSANSFYSRHKWRPCQDPENNDGEHRESDWSAACEQGHEAAEAGDLTPLERKRKTLERKVEEIHELKVKAQEIKFEQGDNVDAIRQWSTQLEERVAVYV